MSHTLPHVLLLNGSLYGGGTEHVIGTLARHLRAIGHRLTIAAVHVGGEVLHELQQDGFDVVTTGGGRGSSARALVDLVDERGVQLVHSHDVRSLIDAAVCRMRRTNSAHVHSFHFGNYPHLPWKQLLMESLACRVPDQLVAVGNAQRSTIVRALRVRESRLVTVWNGVDAADDRISIAPTAGVTGPRIGSVSTFGLQKGLPTLLEAVRHLHDRGLAFQLVLVGEGPLRPELEATTRAYGLDEHVEFTGWRPDAAKTLLPTFDVFVQSSYWEAMSVVILEAMAVGRAIVATTVGENAEVLVDGESALLVPPKDPLALAEALSRVLQDVELRRRLGESAQADYRRRFTGRAMAERYSEIYRRCVAGEAGGDRRGVAAPTM